MTKDEIFEKLQTEVTIRGLSPGTYYTYKRAIDLFLNWTNKPYEELEEIDFRNYLLFLINRGDLTTATINMYNAAIRFFLQVILEKDINYRRTARLRKEYKLMLCKRLTNTPIRPKEKLPAPQMIQKLIGHDITTCPVCGTLLQHASLPPPLVS